MPLRWTAGQDAIVWPYTKPGEYYVKSRYYVLKEMDRPACVPPSTSNPIQQDIWRMIWGAEIPPKIKIFLWKACHNILPVKENLRLRQRRTHTCSKGGQLPTLKIWNSHLLSTLFQFWPHEITLLPPTKTLSLSPYPALQESICDSAIYPTASQLPSFSPSHLKLST